MKPPGVSLVVGKGWLNDLAPGKIKRLYTITGLPVLPAFPALHPIWMAWTRQEVKILNKLASSAWNSREFRHQWKGVRPLLIHTDGSLAG